MKIIEVPELRDISMYPIGCNLKDLKRVTIQYVRMINQFAPKNKRLNFLCRGSSGAILAASVITQIENENSIINHIKKDGEQSHNNSLYINGDDYIIIIDDFMVTGNTLDEIYLKYTSYGIRVNMLLLTSYINKDLSLFQHLDLVICGGALDKIKSKKGNEYELIK